MKKPKKLSSVFHLQKILKKPRHKDYAGMLEWLGIDDPEEFDPAVFNPREVTFQNPRKRLKEYERGFGI